MAAVRDGPWKSLSSGKKVALAAGLSVGATVGYIVYRHIRNCSAEHQIKEQSRLSMPLDVYRSIARHQSTFLDLVNQKSGAQVNVLPDGEEQSAICFLLQGTAEQILLAKCALNKLATDCEVITDVMEVPQTAFGRIIGRGGETLKFINRTSGARVNCPRDRGRNLEESGQVTIMGTRQEVQNAKEMIMEKVLENETVRKRISQSSALRQKRKPPELDLIIHKAQGPENDLMLKLNGEDLHSPLTEMRLLQTSGSNDFTTSADQTAENSLKSDEEEILSPASPLEVSKFEIPSPDLSFQPGEHLEVYVSALENPQHFWIQIVGVRSLQLDKLTTEMSRFYNGDTLQEYRVEAIVVGDIVAAPYQDHDTWNRARVLGILGSGLVDLYYVDFGDNGELPRDQLRSMRSDYLSLPFQAIECSLAGVRPAGEVWTEEALDDFDRLSYCAEWKPLLAKLCSYFHSEMASWPSVKLYDNRHGKIVDLGEELISFGHAVSFQDEGSGLRGEGDEPRSLQKMLDDMTGATSELSMSCISLSGSAPPWQRRQWSSVSCPSSVEVERADVDRNLSNGLMPSSFAFVHSTPSQTLSELVSHVIESSSSVLSPPSCSNLHSGMPLRSSSHHSSSTASSSSSVGVVASALASVTLSDDVFLSSGGSSNATSSRSKGLESSCSICSESVYSSNTSNSSDGIRGVWYYLSSSQEASETSINTNMFASATTLSSSYPSFSSSSITESFVTSPVSSPSIICLSSDPSESDDETTEGDALKSDGLGQAQQKHCVANSSDGCTGSDLIYIGSDKSVFEPLGEETSDALEIKENKPDHVESLGEEEEEVGHQVLIKGMMAEAENEMGEVGDLPGAADAAALIKVHEVASISGSVDDVLEEEFN